MKVLMMNALAIVIAMAAGVGVFRLCNFPWYATVIATLLYVLPPTMLVAASVTGFAVWTRSAFDAADISMCVFAIAVLGTFGGFVVLSIRILSTLWKPGDLDF